MNLLLDTHALIWLGENDQHLSVKAKKQSNFKQTANGKHRREQIIKEIEESDAMILGISLNIGGLRDLRPAFSGLWGADFVVTAFQFNFAKT